MATIPSTINQVTIELSPTVTNDITDEMLAALKAAITSSIDGESVERLWVSSARDGHRCPSRHVTGNGVDISRVNGKRIGSYYDSDSGIKKIVDGLQTRFEDAPHRRENFGPTIQKKNGADHPVSDHKDHFHWSVNGDHSACAVAILDRFKSWRYGTTRTAHPDPEICEI